MPGIVISAPDATRISIDKALSDEVNKLGNPLKQRILHLKILGGHNEKNTKDRNGCPQYQLHIGNMLKTRTFQKFNRCRLMQVNMIILRILHYEFKKSSIFFLKNILASICE
jgi:hypothetical protein